MRRTVALVLCLYALGFTVTEGCSTPPTKTQKEVAAEGAYGAELARCVDAAKTLAESKACRARVDAEWGVVQIRRDAGL